MPLQPGRTVDELRELHALTADEAGAQRVCWTPTWRRAREWYRAKLAELPVEVEQDEAGNLWATLPGDSGRSVVIGGHLDSVENGGWLDGCLNTLAGLEVLRRVAEEGRPPVTIRLVDWADEEGFRFGRSLFGSSAAAGSPTRPRISSCTSSRGRCSSTWGYRSAWSSAPTASSRSGRAGP